MIYYTGDIHGQKHDIERLSSPIISPRCTTDIDTRQSIYMLIPILLMKQILRLILRSVLIASDAGMKSTM